MTTPAVSIAILEKDEVLLVKHKASSRHPLDYYGLPGGAVKEGESYEEAAVREVNEETGLEIDKNDLVKVGTYIINVERKVGEEETSMALYSCKKFRGELKSEAETIPFWAKIPDVLSGKYKMPRISGNFISDVMKLLETS